MCIFCKIINKELPAEIVKETEDWIAFKDINPRAPVHILIVPKKHIESIKELGEEDKVLTSEIIYAAQTIAKEQGCEGYKLEFHVGEKGGQIIFHLHLHLLGFK